MNPVAIVLLIIGIVIIIVSCIVVDHSAKSEQLPMNLSFSYDQNVSDEDKKKLTEKMKEMVSDISEETIIRTDDELSKLSNEKIIAVNEFSDQILEKIKRNHEEVVFLYNMLNDKEKELKSVVQEIDSSKKKVQDILEAKSGAEKLQTIKSMKMQQTEKPSPQITKKVKADSHSETKTTQESELPVINSLNSNNNQQILALYSKGKSVMEISKLLGLGQGEVKLVIDLFKGKK